MLSAFASSLLSAAVAATMSIPTYENMIFVKVVLGESQKRGRQHGNPSIPDPKERSDRTSDIPLEIPAFIFYLVHVIEEGVW